MNNIDLKTVKIAMVKVALVDDHKILVDSLKMSLKDEPEIEVAITAYNGKELMEALKSTEVDIVLLDINMPEMDGIETIKVLKKDYPNINVIILSTLDETRLIRQILKLGAMGYVLKNTSKDELVRAINVVYGNNFYFTPSIQKALTPYIKEKPVKVKRKAYPSEGHHGALTKRELEILKLIVEEHTGAEIADILFISKNTVETHRKNMVQKLGVKNIVGLVKYAIKHGLVDN